MPYRFRRCFPVAHKANDSHDVLPLCLDCRESADRARAREEKRLAKTLPPAPDRAAEGVDERLRRAIGAAKALLGGATIPSARADELRAVVAAGAGAAALDGDAALAGLAATPPPKRARARVSADDDSLEARVVRRLLAGAADDGETAGRVAAFAMDWRAIFLAAVDPRHLPAGWAADRAARPRRRKDPGETACRAFAAGKCAYGGACKYIH